MIEWENSQSTIKNPCELLDLPRSTAYHTPVEITPSEDEISIKNAINRIHYEELSYGVRRIKNELHNVGFKTVGRRLVKRYIREMDIYAFCPGPNLSKRAKA